MRRHLWRRANIYVMPRCSAFQINDDAEPQPRGLVAIWFGLMGLSVIVLALLAYRMTIWRRSGPTSCAMQPSWIDG